MLKEAPALRRHHRLAVLSDLSGERDATEVWANLAECSCDASFQSAPPKPRGAIPLAKTSRRCSTSTICTPKSAIFLPGHLCPTKTCFFLSKFIVRFSSPTSIPKLSREFVLGWHIIVEHFLYFRLVKKNNSYAGQEIQENSKNSYFHKDTEKWDPSVLNAKKQREMWSNGVPAPQMKKMGWMSQPNRDFEPPRSAVPRRFCPKIKSPPGQIKGLVRLGMCSQFFGRKLWNGRDGSQQGRSTRRGHQSQILRGQ